MYMKKVSADDPISRAGLSLIKNSLNRVIERVPAVVDPDIFRIMTSSMYEEVYVISGRRTAACRRIHEFLRKYKLQVQGVACRGNLPTAEWKFKLDQCKQLGLIAFYEDRPPVARVLRQNGVNVVLWG